MSNNIYDILGKLPKDNPTVDIEESGTLYENVDPRGDILEAIQKLEEKYYKDRIQPGAAQAQQSDTIRYQSDNPLVKGFLQRAYQEFPNSANDNEATLALISKDKQDDDQRQVAADSWMSKAQNKINDQQEKMQDMAQVIIDQEKRFQEFNKQVASANLPIQKQAQAAVDFAKDTTQQPSAVIGKYAEPQQSIAQEPAKPTAEPSAKIYDLPTQGQQPAPKAGPKTKADKGRPKLSLVKDTGKDFVDIDPEDLTTFVRPEQKVAGSDITEAVQMIYPEGSPALGQFNFEKIKNAYFQKLPKVDLIFGDSAEKLTDADIYAIVAWFYVKSKKNADLQPNLAARNLSTQKDVQRLLRTDMVNHYRSRWGSLKRSLAQKNITTQPLDFNKPKAPAPQQQQPATVKPVVQPKKGQLDLFNEKHTMKNLEQLQEILMKKFQGFESVEEGKKLKDKKQFDDVAEPGDYYLTDKGNKVIKTKSGIKHEKVHAGDKDNDDLDESAKPDYIDLDKDGDKTEPMKKAAKDAKKIKESGLQAYLGKKKYGKEGMQALQQAGREGASKEKMALIRAKHDKMDESAIPDTEFVKWLRDTYKKEVSQLKAEEYVTLTKQFQDFKNKKYISMDKGLAEVAPPGAKAERMVKHIKKGYSKDGKLTPKEKGIAYATAWKAHNKGQVEEGTEFGDTIKNSEAKMTKVKMTEGKEAIRNHPIYTNEEAWNHYKQELDEQETLEAKCMEAPVVDVQEELNEIARLAGLAPKMETKSVCPSCKCEQCECNETLDPMVPNDSASPLTHTEEGMGCSMRELEEAMSRKHYREMADKIKNMADRDDAEKICRTFVEMAKADNPRFKEDMFYAACGVKEDHGMMSEPSTVLVGEEETMDEGNEFTKARLDAIAAGKDTFTVGGKTYKVSGDTSDEKTQVESVIDDKQEVTEDINLNVTANGEEDVVNLIRKLSGMPMIAIQTPSIGGETMEEQTVEEERDIQWDNTPSETVDPISSSIPSGTDLHRSKLQDPETANKAANPLKEKHVEESLWKAYETMINDLKA